MSKSLDSAVHYGIIQVEIRREDVVSNFHRSLGAGCRGGGSLMKKGDFVKLTKGDIVKNTYHHKVIKPEGGNEVGVVLEPPKKDDKYPQVLVWARTGGKNYWHMAVVEVVNESR